MSFSVRRSLAWMSLAQVISFVILFVGSAVLAHLLTPLEMGVYAAAAAVLGILATLRTFGLPNIIIREQQLTPAVSSTTFTINACLCLLSALLILTASQLIGLVYTDPSVSRVLLVLALVPVISIFEFLPAACLERAGAFHRISAINIARALLATVVTIVLALLGFSSMSLAWGNVASGLFGAVAVSLAGPQYVSLRPGLSQWRRVGVFGAQLLTLNVLSAVVQRSFDLVLGRIVGLSALGLWSRASGLNNMLWDNIHNVVARITFVDFSERGRRGLSLRDAYLRVIGVLTAVLWPAFVGIAILSGPIVYTVYGAPWIGAALPLALMSLGGAAITSVTLIWEVFVAKGEMAAQIRYQLKRTVISAAMFVAGCFGGLDWAAASRVGDGIVAVVLVKPDIQRMTDTTDADFRPIYLRSAGAAVAACLPSFVLMQAFDWSVATPFGLVLAAVGLGVLLWLAALRVLRHPLFDEISAAVEQALAKLRARRTQAQAR